MNRLRELIHEIHRRSLWQVLAGFAVGSYAVLQAIDLFIERLGLPDWLFVGALFLMVAGLPVVMATAFVQGADAEGDEGESVPAPVEGLLTWRNAIVGGVLAFALLGFVGTGWVLFGGGLPTSEPSVEVQRSVAVLPFVNMSGNPENEYFSDGITEELLNALAQLPDLRVPARTSSFAFKGQNIPIRQIADTLDVAHVVEGSVRRDGDRVRITAQLVDARSEASLWSDTFERRLDDIFAIQREIASGIADQLQVTLSGEQRETLVTDATESTEAHEAYLRGRYFWNQRTGESLHAAIAEFDRAVELDPNYADAWAGLAGSYLLIPEYGPTGEPREWTQRGIDAARQALSISPNLPMARASLGFGLQVLGEWEPAREELRKAVELAPGYATAHQWYGFALYSTGRAEEGLQHSRTARDLDPVSQVISANLGRALRSAGRMEDAIRQFQETTELAPDWPTGWTDLAIALLDVGRYEQGTEAWLQAASLFGADTSAWEQVYEAAIRYRETGGPQISPRIAQTMPRLAIAAKTGDRDFALEVLGRHAQQGTLAWLATARFTYGSDALLSDDPDFQALMQNAGIDW